MGLRLPRSSSGAAYRGVTPAALDARRRSWPPSPGVDQAEVGHLDVVADQEEVVRLDVEVLQAVLEVHPVEGLGGLEQVAEQFVAGDAGLARALAVGCKPCRLWSASSMTMTRTPSMTSTRSSDRMNGWRIDLDALEGLQFLGGGGGCPSLRRGRPTNLMALNRPPGLALPDFAEAPLPSGSISR